MTYYIFLKSLRSLEEFRKNPHVKIPPKSPSTIFQSLAIIQKSNFIRKRSFPSLSAQSAHPGLRGLGVFAKSRLFFEFEQPGDDAFSLCHPTRAPPIGFIISPTPADPGRNFSTPPLPPRRCHVPRMPPSFYSPPSSLSPLNPLQTER
jgi:hypothetical protein